VTHPRDIRESPGISAKRSKLVANIRLNFTKKELENLAAPALRATYVYDSRVRGLAMRLAAKTGRKKKGRKVFVLYRRIAGRPERVTIGEFPEWTIEKARARAQEMNAAIARGENPSEEQRTLKAENTIGELFAMYLEQHAKQHKKSWADDEWTFNKYLHSWRLRKLSAVRAEDVKTLHARIGRDNGKYAANRVVELLSTMFNRARDWGSWKGENPAAHVKAYRERKRERFLLPEEFPAFFAALADEQNGTFRDYVIISLLTGARRANVQAMRWSEINFKLATWHIPQEKTKSGESVTIPLVDRAIAILEARRARVTGDWVFPGKGSTGHLVEPKRAWASLLKRAGITDLRLHDLRRTLGSWEASTGASLIVIGKTLGHTNTATTQVYARLNLDPVRAAVSKATDAMLLAAGEEPKLLVGKK
jgi:integrase